MRPANEELLSGKSLPFKVWPNNYIYRKEIARTHCEQFHCGLRSKYCSEEIVSLKEDEGFCWGPAMLIFNQRFAFSEPYIPSYSMSYESMAMKAMLTMVERVMKSSQKGSKTR